MKKAPLNKLLLILILSVLFIFPGCKKENSGASNLTPIQEEESAMVSAQSETETELATNDIFDNVIGASNEVGMSGTGVFGRIAAGGSLQGGRDLQIDSIHCFTVNIIRLNTNEPFPVKITIDFGNGCLGKDGHMRFGKIITVYTGRLIVSGKSATTIFEGYKIDSFSIEGTQIISNTSSSSQRQFTVDVIKGKISKPNGNYSEWESHRLITQTDGSITPEWPIDDVFTIDGSANGKVKNGNTLYVWKSEITDPLIKKFTCPWIVKGILKVRRETLSSNSPWAAILDYGSGLCDNKATLTINGIGHQITLH